MPDLIVFPLSKGFETLIDASEYCFVKEGRWHYNLRGYAFGIHPSYGKRVYLHRLLMARWGLLELQNSDQKIDHIDLNKLHNFRNNLRLVTNNLNSHHVNVRSNNTSGFRGVSYFKPRGVYHAYLMYPDKKKKHLGSFANPVNAAKAYDKEAYKLYGENAMLNFPEEYL